MSKNAADKTKKTEEALLQACKDIGSVSKEACPLTHEMATMITEAGKKVEDLTILELCAMIQDAKAYVEIDEAMPQGMML